MGIEIPVVVCPQNNKHVLMGALKASDAATWLMNGWLDINHDAQRTLLVGQKRESTRHLLRDGSAHKTDRIKAMIEFVKIVIDEVDKGTNSTGFYGSAQLILPVAFEGAVLRKAEVPKEVPSFGLNLFNRALGTSLSFGLFEANPMQGQTVLTIGDGQCRIVTFAALLMEAEQLLVEAVNELRRYEKKHMDTESSQQRERIAELEQQLKRCSEYVSQTFLPVLIYVSSVAEDGALVGLNTKAEQRLYIEANSYNSKAAQTEALKFASDTPAIMALRELRTDANEWMTSDHIEEDSKTVGQKSYKVFTLSALTQAFSLSMFGQADRAMKSIDEGMIKTVKDRKDFTTMFWSKVTNVLGETWVPEVEVKADRLQYLLQRRQKRDVRFQATFLQALGLLGFWLGQDANWDALNDRQFDRLGRLAELDQSQYEATGSSDWNNRMMTSKEKAGEVIWTFNNTRDTVRTVAQWMADQLQLNLNTEDHMDDDATSLEDDTAELVTA